MNTQRVETLDGKRKERYSDIRQAELAMLCAVYKVAFSVSLVATACLIFNAGWRAKQVEIRDIRIDQLEKAVNDAQWELEQSPPPEGTMRAIKHLEGVLK